MPDQRVRLSYGRITMDASLALQLGGLHLVALTGAQRYIVRRLLGYAQRESHYYVSFNDDGTYTTPSEEQMDGILARVDDLEDKLMALPDYREGTQVVELLPVTSGYIYLDADWRTLAWVRIGRAVHLGGRLLVSSVNAPVGILRLMDLPFSVAAGGPGYAAMSLLANALLAGATPSLQGIFIGGQSYAQIYLFSAGQVLPMSEYVQAGSILYIGGAYFTDDE